MRRRGCENGKAFHPTQANPFDFAQGGLEWGTRPAMYLRMTVHRSQVLDTVWGTRRKIDSEGSQR